MNHDDPTLTAYLLGETGELSPEEAKACAELLQNNPAAATEAAELRAFAERLRRDLQTESAESLASEQRAAIFAREKMKMENAPLSTAHSDIDDAERFTRNRRFFRVALPWGLAASLAVLAGSWLWQEARHREPRKLAQNPIPSDELDGKKLAVASSPFGPLQDAPTGAASTEKIPAAGPASLAKDHGLLHTSPSPASESLLASKEQLQPAASSLDDRRLSPASGGLAQESGPANLTLAMAAPATSSSPADAGEARTASPQAAQKNLQSAPLAVSDKQPKVIGGIMPLEQNRSSRDRELFAGATRADHSFAKGKSSLARDSVSAASMLDSDLRTTGFLEFLDGESVPREGESPSSSARFAEITENLFRTTRSAPLSTFSIDVDTASYAIVRRFLESQQLPPTDAVRIEELVNYFHYDYPEPAGDQPFSTTLEAASCPWAPAHRLVRIGLRGREVTREKRPAGNLVFLLDVSGSMSPQDRLPLLKQSLRLLVEQLTPEDQVSIVVYAGASGCVLPPTHDPAKILAALDHLEAGGSTNGGSGIRLAYDIAEKNFLRGGTNRVILATDGDFNVGLTSQSALQSLIKTKAKSGVFLTVLGVGMDNLKDATLEKLADQGNGNYAYLDSLREAQKVLVEQLSGTLVTIAKDVKIQVEFNPAQVSAYRLIGYEKRLLRKEDFADDSKDAGEIGAGHRVTALYEVIPANAEKVGEIVPLKYQDTPPPEARPSVLRSEAKGEMLTLQIRYKAPDGETSKLLEVPFTDGGAAWEKSSPDFHFAAAVASFGMLLRDSPGKGNASWDSVEALAQAGQTEMDGSARRDFLELIRRARALHR